MIHFDSDYLEGADERVMQALLTSNSEQTPGYGQDGYCEEARGLIRVWANCPKADVQFVVGGTQANLIVISTALRPWEGVLCAETGHINAHETGAIEATGHKVLPLPEAEGKISADQVREAARMHRMDVTREHIVKPAMVYISHPTEFGTLYTREELCAISEACREAGLWLFLDGARLGYGLAADPQVDLPLIARLCDAFTIGGTKAGFLFGEAIVLPNEKLHDSFRYAVKQRGGMLAKGRLLGVQFMAMISDGYYVQQCARANALAQKIQKAFLEKGFSMLSHTLTNQVFPILPTTVIEKLQRNYGFSHWKTVDSQHCAVRFCTSVTTKEATVSALIQDISSLTIE